MTVASALSATPLLATPLLATPLSAAEFATRMTAIGPFERPPRLAVAVSGGTDSLALALLAHDWAGARGGDCLHMIVDHGLRPHSADEAAGVAESLRRSGMAAQVLSGADASRAGLVAARPGNAAGGAGGIEARARALRYRLLEAACHAAGRLHLLLAHHRDDQAETLLMRLAAGSGVDGLAGMAAETARPQLRLVRPLLTVPRERLVAVVATAGLSAVTDPMNTDRQFARPRLRRSRRVLAREGLTSIRLGRLAADAAVARADRRAMLAEDAAAAVTVDPLGFLWLDPGPVLRGDRRRSGDRLARLLLAAVRAVSGDPYGPRTARLLAAADRIAGAWTMVAGPAADRRQPPGGFRGLTVGGCLLRPGSRRDDAPRLLLCREPAAMAPAIPLTREAMWDGRFRWPKSARPGWRFGPLDGAGWAAADAATAGRLAARVPAAARQSLPALIPPNGDGVALLARKIAGPEDESGAEAIWQPARPLTGADAATVVSGVTACLRGNRPPLSL